MKFEMIDPPIVARARRLERELDDYYWKAWKCLKWLRSQGFEVLNVQVYRGCARVEIAASSLCMLLEGANYMTERQLNQPTKRFYMAIRFDCQVCWSVREVH